MNKTFILILAVTISTLTQGQLIVDGRPVAGSEVPRQFDDLFEPTEAKPGIQLKAPIKCEVGELIEFSAAGSNVDSLVWAIIPHTPDFKIVTNERIAFFSAREPGKSFRLVIAGAKDGQAFLVHQVLTVKGVSVPASGLAAKVSDWVREVSPDDKDATLRAMARVFRRLAIDEDISVDEILQATAIANSAVLGDDLESWTPFLDKLGNELDDMIDDGRLSTKEQYQRAWIDIADGLTNT